MGIVYRPVIVLLILLSFVWFFFPWEIVYRGNSINSLFWLGRDAWLGRGVISVTSIIVTALAICAYIGLYFYKRWARRLLFIIVVLGGLAIPMYGISVSSGYESMIMYFVSVGEGFLLAASYSSVLNVKFSR